MTYPAYQVQWSVFLFPKEEEFLPWNYIQFQICIQCRRWRGNVQRFHFQEAQLGNLFKRTITTVIKGSLEELDNYGWYKLIGT